MGGPGKYDNTLDDDYAVSAVEKFAQPIPGTLGSEPVLVLRGCYDVTPDYNPVIGPAPVENLYLCAGFSGHGYKIAPAVGDLMADIIPRRHEP